MAEPSLTYRESVAIRLGSLIREQREHAGLTQQDLADTLGVTQTAVSYWESGVRLPDLAVLIRTARALHVGAGELVQRTAATVEWTWEATR